MDLAQIGATLKNHRMIAKISQESLAKAAGVSRATVNGLERGTLNDLGYSKVLALLSVVGCEVVASSPAKTAETQASTKKSKNAKNVLDSELIALAPSTECPSSNSSSNSEIFETRVEFLKELQTSRLMKGYAKKYIWWQQPKTSLSNPLRVVAQTMDIGNWDDVRSLRSLVGEDVMRETLKNASPGWFRPRSWAYWTAVLNLQSELPSKPVTRPKRTFHASLPDELQHSS
jgi:transcriptional regulator with XRE-family HTH domain